MKARDSKSEHDVRDTDRVRRGHARVSERRKVEGRRVVGKVLRDPLGRWRVVGRNRVQPCAVNDGQACTKPYGVD